MKTNKIAHLNDNLRTMNIGGRIQATQSVIALDDTSKAKLFNAIQSYQSFTTENDPWGEHDFGMVEVDGQHYYWKIDYYNADMTAGSEDPSDPNVTTRVLTIMHSSEY